MLTTMRARLWRLRIVWVLLGLAVLVGAFALAFVGAHPQGSQDVQAGSTIRAYRLRLSFGLSQNPVTRSTRLNLCDHAEVATKAECPNSSAAKKPQPTGSASGANAASALRDRPEVLTAGLAEDLEGDNGSQFPGAQITVTATNVGRSGLLIAVTADPADPRSVPEGNYAGDIVVERAAGTEPIVVHMRAQLAARGGRVSERVLAALLLGALGGAGVKWLDTTFTPMAQLRRKQRRLGRWLFRREADLPEGVTESYNEVQEAVRQLDADGVDSAMGALTTAEPDLLAFAYAITAFRQEVSEQERFLGGAAAIRDAPNAVETELAYLADLQHRPWPWEGKADVRAGYTKALEHTRAFTNALRAFAMDPVNPDTALAASTLARQIVVAGSVGLEQELPAAPLNAAVPAGVDAVHVAPPKTSAQLSTSERSTVPPRNFTERALDNAWWITLVVGALVVTFVGYQTQFLDNKAFTGSLTDQVKLFGWALALQIAGTTVVQVVGRLTTAPASV